MDRSSPPPSPLTDDRPTARPLPWLLTTALALGACAGDGPAVGGSAGTTNSEDDDDDTGDDDSDTTGGDEVPGVVVFIPDGAIDDPIEPTILEIDASNYPGPEELVSGLFEIGPAGTEFAQPVTVGFPIDPDTPAGTSVTVMHFDEATQQWEKLPGTTIVGSTVLAKATSFSPFGTVNDPNASGCDNLWSGGPGKVVPLLGPGGITVSPGVRMNEEIAWSGPSQMALGSTWVVDACSATVSGNFGAGLDGAGGWIDYSQGGTGDIPQDGSGAFSFPLAAAQGPYMGLTDPCNVGYGGYLYSLNIHFTAVNCGDLCDGVTCNGDDGDPCTTDTCNPGTGQCEPQPSAGACGSNGGGLCVQGQCMVEVSMNAGQSGDSLCTAEGLTCADTPVLAPPEAACLAFNPDATVSADANGWRQSVYCDDDMGLACGGRVNDCHDCPACDDTGLGCGQTNTDQLSRVYARCVQ